jgi:uncharacterized coiled-coil DUF342 family protein
VINLKRLKDWAIYIWGIIVAVLLIIIKMLPNKKNEELKNKADKLKESTNEDKKFIEQQKEDIVNDKKQLEEMHKEADNLKNRLNKLLLIIIMIISMGLIPIKALADTPSANIPNNYDDLKTKYLELWDITWRYKELYEKADALNIKLLNDKQELTTRYDDLLTRFDALYKLNNDLYELNKKALKGNFIDLNVGITVEPFDYEKSSLYLEISLKLL